MEKLIFKLETHFQNPQLPKIILKDEKSYVDWILIHTHLQYPDTWFWSCPSLGISRESLAARNIDDKDEDQVKRLIDKLINKLTTRGSMIKDFTDFLSTIKIEEEDGEV